MPPQQPGPLPAARIGNGGTGRTPLAALWRARSYLRPYRWQLAFMLAAAIVAVLSEIAIPLLTKSMIDGAISHGRRDLLLPIGAAAVGLGVLQAVLNFLRRWVQANAVTGLDQAMRADIYAHLQWLPPEFHDVWQSGQLLSRATNDLAAIRRFAGFGTVFLITNTITFIAVIGLLIRLNWWLGLLTGTVFLPVVWASTRFQRRYRVLSRRSQDQQGDLATYVEEAATGIRVLKALGRGGEAATQHAGQAAEVFGTELAKARLRSTFWAGLDLIPNAMIGVLLLLGAIAVGRHELTLGGLVAFITLTLMLLWPIESMGYILAGGQEAATAAQRIYEILDTEPSIKSPARRSGRSRATPPRRRPAKLVFDRVGFRYPGAEHALLRGLSLTVEPGQTMVLVGATGAGKTTLLQLVPRLADVTSGAVLLDGTDVRRLPLAELRSTGRLRVRGPDPVLRERAGERQLRRSGRGRGGDRGRAGHGPGRFRARPALGAGHPDRRAGHGAVRRPAAAGGAGPGHPGPAVAAHPGRPAVRARRAHRGPGDRGAARAAGRDDRAGSRAPAVHGRPGRPGRAAPRRDDHGHRDARPPAGHPAPVPGPDERQRPGRAGTWRAGGVMTSTTGADAWRGIAAEEAEQMTAGLAALLRTRARRLLIRLLRPQRARVIGTLLLIVAANLAALAGPWLVGVAIDRGIPPLLHGGHLGPLVLSVAGFVASVLLQAVTTRAFIYEMGRIGETFVIELRRLLFAHFQRLPVAFHEHYTSGRVISRQVSDIDSISDLFNDGLDALVSAVFSLVLVGIGMLLLDWPLALVVLAGFGPLAWLTFWFRRESAVAYRRTRETIAQVIVHFVETFGGIRAVQAFRREGRNEEIFAELNGQYAQASKRSSRLLAVYSPGITLVGNVATGVVLCYGGLRVLDGDIKVGVLATFLLYLGRFFDPLQDLSQFYNSFQSAAAALEKISGVLDEPPAVPEPAVPVRLPARRGPGRAVRFAGVRFGYRDSLVLPGLDLDIPAGQTVALVGATGAGKTTIARLLARFYDPGAGPGAAGRGGSAGPRRPGPAAREWSWSPRRTSCSPGPWRTTSSWAGRAPAGPRSRPRPRPSARTSSSPGCPAGSTPMLGSAAAGCRPGSGSSSRSPASSLPRPPSWCWTRPPRCWTSPASGRCRRRCAPSWRAGPR